MNEASEYETVLSLIRVAEALLEEKKIEINALKEKIKALKERLKKLESGQLRLY